MPQVSVVLTSYNCAPYIPKAIESILDQTHSDLELLISDDASIDGSADIIAAYAARDDRIRFFKQAENIGLVRNYNFLFAKAEGDYVAIQDADDWSDPARFAMQVDVLADNRFVLCGTGSIFHYPSGGSRELELNSSRVIAGIEEEFPSHPASVMRG
jgi:glycosyltransferase involved in cell wall biosynthesis